MSLFRKLFPKKVLIPRYCPRCGGEVVVDKNSIGATQFDPLTGIPTKMETKFKCNDWTWQGCYVGYLVRNILPEEIEEWKQEQEIQRELEEMWEEEAKAEKAKKPV
jgi:hypothetical protein